jgi:type II secretory pathway component GspD/PulD (secretin)
VSDDGHIILDIHPKVSDGVVTNGLPTETTTEVSTTVLVRDGETIFIGGLLRHRDEGSRAGIPVLSRIPLLGYLFGRDTRSFSRSEVVVLITPRIVKQQSADKATPLELDVEPREIIE